MLPRWTGEPCAKGKDMLKSQLSVLLEPDENLFEMITESDVEDPKTHTKSFTL